MLLESKMARKRKRNITPPAVVAAKQESASKVSRPLPQLPTDIIQCIFDALESFEDGSDSTLEQQKFWIILSLVCKDWAKMVIIHRKILILPTARSVKRYVAHNSKLQASGVITRHLRSDDASIPEEILLKLVPLVSRTLTSLSIPADALQSRYVHDLMKSGHCKLEKIHVYSDRLSIANGDWWKKAYRLHRIDTLFELKLSRIVFQGEFREFQASVLSPIRTLHLQSVSYKSKKAIEHFAWPLIHTLRSITLTNIGTTPDDKQSVVIELCRILGHKLLCLRIVHDMRWSPGFCMKQLFPMLPVLENLEVEGQTFFEDCRVSSHRQCYLQLPQTLKHCKLRLLSWEAASGFFQIMSVPQFLPHLQSVPIIQLLPDAKARHQREVDENNADLIAVESSGRRFKSFELR